MNAATHFYYKKHFFIRIPVLKDSALEIQLVVYYKRYTGKKVSLNTKYDNVTIEERNQKFCLIFWYKTRTAQ